MSAATAQPRAFLVIYSDKGVGNARGRPKKAPRFPGFQSQTGCSAQSRFFGTSPVRDTTLTLTAYALRSSPFHTARGFPYLHIAKRVCVRFSDRQTARSRWNLRTRECKLLVLCCVFFKKEQQSSCVRLCFVGLGRVCLHCSRHRCSGEQAVRVQEEKETPQPFARRRLFFQMEVRKFFLLAFYCLVFFLLLACIPEGEEASRLFFFCADSLVS